MFRTTAYDLFHQEADSRKLITRCSALDRHLGGGVKLGTILEFCGGPGTGKTQFCLQLCVTVQIPRDCGGLGGKAIFIDTNQDFSPERLKEISEGILVRFQKVVENTSSKEDFTLKHILSRISYVYCSNHTELLAQTILLESILKTDRELKLIVIDSFGSIIRQIDDDVSERIRIAFEILTRLHKLAVEYKFAIVITNELTTSYNGKAWSIHPALGNTHLHKINEQIILSRSLDTDKRYAFVAKSVEAAKDDIPFQITPSGIRSLNSRTAQ